MSTSNMPEATATTTIGKTTATKNYKNIVIAALSVALVSTGGYMAYQKSQSSETITQQQAALSTASIEKSELQSSFDASLARLDSMETVTNSIKSELADKNNEIANAKKEIRSILNKKDASAAELKKARTLIASLNSKIEGMEAEIARLTTDNQLLGEQKQALIVENEKINQELAQTKEVKQQLEKKVDVGSTLYASNFVITPVDVRKNGKEKKSDKAKKVDKMMVTFDVNNRIVQPGTTDLYVLVIGPDGQPVTSPATTGSFTTREDGEKSYTAKVPVELETAQTKNVSFSFNPGNKFQTGQYTIQIYQNGFLIGKGTRALKKGGLFS